MDIVNYLNQRSHFHHYPLLLSRVSAGSSAFFWSFRFRWNILALLALTIFSTPETGLVTLTVLLQTVGLLTIATLEMLIRLNFLPKRVWVTIHQRHYSIVPFLVVSVKVVAAYTVAAIACLV